MKGRKIQIYVSGPCDGFMFTIAYGNLMFENTK